MKKILAFLLAAVMLFAVAGCSQDGSDSKTPAGSQASGGAMPAVAKDDLKVGVIQIGEPADGAVYSYAHDQGIVAMQKELGLKDSQIIRKNNISDSDTTAIENAMMECIEEGCNIIFATSWGYMDTCEKLAEEYPDVLFCHGTGYKSNGTNFNNYFGRIYQSRYLSGVAAGLKTESNMIGYVGAMGQENGEVTSGIDAFAMGVESVNPDAKVYVKITNSWYDPEGESQAAKALIDMGCDVIGQHCDTPNPQLEAEKAGVWGVGYNSDMTKDAPGAVLCSVEWNWGAFYTQAVKNVIDGTWVIGEHVDNYFGDMADGLVVLSDLSDLCADGTADAVQAAEDKIVSGEWDVFDGKTEIEDNAGEMHTVEGADYGSINWYYRNVVQAG